MELFKPNAQLVKHKVSENPDVWEYMLYSQITTDHSHYVGLEFDQSVFTLNSDGHYAVDLKIKKDDEVIVDREYLKPILHIVDLDNVSFSESNPTIEIHVKEEITEGGTTTTQQKGSTTVLHTSTADEDGKPM